MKERLLGVLLAGALAFPTYAEEPGKPAVVPVKKAPFHLFTFEDENMSLENVTLPPGMSTRYHSHDQDLVFVITAGAKITNQVLGKEPAELEFKQGEVRFAGYTKTPGVHQSQYRKGQDDAVAGGRDRLSRTGPVHRIEPAGKI
jgi:hypothetical protein